MQHPPDGPEPLLGDPLLAAALTCVIDSAVGLSAYTFAPVEGATQATVWRGTPLRADLPGLALRLTPKPAKLVRRIGELVDGVSAVACPRTLAAEELTTGGRTWTVHLCTWIGNGAPTRPDVGLLGRQLALLHQDLAATVLDFSDRGLSFERGWKVPAEQELPASYVASHLWRDRIYAWLYAQSERMAAQPIHGDMHWGNVVATDDGFGFIDFDKVMFAPPVFDLAKLMATGMFRTGERTRFQVRKATQLLEGYESVRVLSPAELVALEALAVLLNEQTALLGARHDIKEYRATADAVASWWIARRRRSPTDPLGIRSSRRLASDRDIPGQELPGQEPLWADPDQS